MGIRIRKSIKIVPGVRLNFGKKGISTSIGKRGAGITIGPTGTTAHIGVPGTGVSYVKKIGTTKKSGPKNFSSTCHMDNSKQEKNNDQIQNILYCLILAFIGIGILVTIAEYGFSPFAIIALAVVFLLEVKILYNNFTIQKGDNEIKEKKSIIKEATRTNPISEPLNVTLSPINPKEPFTRYKYPTLSLLKKYENQDVPIDEAEQKANKDRIIEVLGNFGVQIKAIHATVGPTITLYEMQLVDDVPVSKVQDFEDEISISLSAFGVRIITHIPGKDTFGIEIPNSRPNIEGMESVLKSLKFQETTMELPLALGKTVTNEVFMVDLAKIQHLLIAGSNGQNRSLGLDNIIVSLLYKKHPNELKFVFIDFNKIDLNVYTRIANHFMASLPDEEEPVVTDASTAVRTLNSLCQLIDIRYNMLKKAGARDVKEYNEKFINRELRLVDGHEYMPYIVVIINEFIDLFMAAGEYAERPIVRITQLAHNVGIHMIFATHRVNTSINKIKSNIPGRIAFRVTSGIDSKTVLDSPGANFLIGQGDMLYVNNSEPVRVQCAIVDTPEIESINEYISNQPGPIEPLELPESDNNTEVSDCSVDMCYLDPFFEQAARCIVLLQQGSTSLIQRRFSIGYNRAGRIMDQLEKAGIVGEAQGSRPREVLITNESQLNLILLQLAKSQHEQTTSMQFKPYNKKDIAENQTVERNIQKENTTTEEKEDAATSNMNPQSALMSLIGLTSVKDEIVSLVNFIKLNKKRAEQGLPVTQIAFHSVFTGNPGTGKTTVARLLAGIFKELGVLKKGQLIETDRSGLVAEYVGQTAVKTNKIIDSALDGVLFIDEAYTLAQGGNQDFGHEAIATLLKRMEDNRDRLIVILAGYGSEMKTFIDSNPGLRSRFNRYINFPDYTPKDLLEIFKMYLDKQQYILSESALIKVSNYLTQEVSKGQNDFGNARFVRNLFEKSITQQANRLVNIENCDKDLLRRIEEDDIVNSIERM